jgi:hypothetical protein
MKTKYADRRCPVCPKTFTPTRANQRACGFHCARTLAGRTLKAKGTPAPLARQQLINASQRRRRIALECMTRFGPLNGREAALFAFGSSTGYSRGYARGYAARPRSGRKVGAA